MEQKNNGNQYTRWNNSGQIRLKERIIYSSGSRDRQYIDGVAVILNENLQKSVKNVVPFSLRVLLLQLAAYCETLSLILVRTSMLQ